MRRVTKLWKETPLLGFGVPKWGLGPADLLRKDVQGLTSVFGGAGGSRLAGTAQCAGQSCCHWGLCCQVWGKAPGCGLGVLWGVQGG